MPATFLLPTVSAELRSIRMQIDDDVRLAAAAGGAARYFADAAGLAGEAVAHLQAAVLAACQAAFHELGNGHANLDVTLTWLADRIEVSMSHKEATPTSADRNARETGASAEALEGVDEVQHETHDGVVVTRLTKFIKQGAASR
jgi:hypothetical protein